MNTEATIKRIKVEIKRLNAQIRWLKEHSAALKKVDSEPSMFASSLDFDNLKHPKIIQLVRTLGGKWNKTPGDNGTVHYQAEIDGMSVRCWRGEPPPNCKLVPFEVHVPAHTKTEYKLVCPKGANGN